MPELTPKQVASKLQKLLPDYTVEARDSHPYIEVCVSKDNEFVRYYMQADADDKAFVMYAKTVGEKLKQTKGYRYA